VSAAAGTFLAESTIKFYRHALKVMRDAGVQALVGGAYAFARYTGIERHTKDFDVFIRRGDFDKAAAAFRAAGYDVAARSAFIAELKARIDAAAAVDDSFDGRKSNFWGARHLPQAVKLVRSVPHAMASLVH
jgi:hypothetical protein